jgi:hypothetical protein
MRMKPGPLVRAGPTAAVAGAARLQGGSRSRSRGAAAAATTAKRTQTRGSGGSFGATQIHCLAKSEGRQLIISQAAVRSQPSNRCADGRDCVRAAARVPLNDAMHEGASPREPAEKARPLRDQNRREAVRQRS